MSTSRLGAVSLLFGCGSLAAIAAGFLLYLTLEPGVRAPCGGGPDFERVFLGSLLFALLGIVLGHAARHRNAKRGLLASYAGLALIILLLFPNVVLRSRCASNDAAAVGALRTLNTAITQYASTYGALPPNLEALGPDPGPWQGNPPKAEASAQHADLIDSVLASGGKSGFLFTYKPSPAGPGKPLCYAIEARPVEFGKSGQRNYFTDESGVVRQTEGNRPATANDPPL